MIFLHQIDPVAVSLGPLRVHWYGLMYLLGFLLAWWLGRRRIRAGRLPGVDEDGFGDLLFYGLIGVIVGGRLGSVLFYDFNTYLQNPLQVLKVWEGGMSFHGGLIGVLVAAWLWSRRHRRHFFDTMDFLAPLVPPGLGFGRIGNYIGGELWGKYTRGDWGVVFPSGLPEPYRSLDPVALKAQFDAGALDAFARHPSQLYQAFLEGLVLFCVLWWYSAKPRPRYAVSGLFALLYGSFRFLVEFVRMPDAHLGYLAFGWLTMGQVLSLPLVALGLFLLWRSRSAPVLQPQSVPPAKEAKR
ncbi:MAG: prolipoprotein diacylglyceryl transferase [Pseudoxanthomonas sp.]|nr:prolipoprotein diacylglyceryl transferase [Pseudoxanthomonas sp.]MBP7466225.1 prolipoprotein diacylglyceryl transferase [Pseudoxanthomonas sp.]MBP8740802.1 prolipoprotein diacylglyceryl transferase [Pseudoxanthomonas sp.]MBP8803642.1 prolipoprotein diacylglyceryl transferase [Pseudoxanthomonas sp.]MBP8909206.1 prolipoprotein diacylglyceryl transferase [Pseudoxanthomonas sp.]